MKEQLTREQIEKAENSMRDAMKSMLSGKVAINYRDHKRNKGKMLLYCGSVTVRQMLRIITELKQYKQLEQQTEEVNKE